MVCLFYPDRTNSIHIALIVELIFLIQYVLIKKSPAIKVTPEAETIVQTEQQTVLDYDIEKKKSNTTQNQISTNKQEAEVFS